MNVKDCLQADRYDWNRKVIPHYYIYFVQQTKTRQNGSNESIKKSFIFLNRKKTLKCNV